DLPLETRVSQRNRLLWTGRWVNRMPRGRSRERQPNARSSDPGLRAPPQCTTFLPMLEERRRWKSRPHHVVASSPTATQTTGGSNHFITGSQPLTDRNGHANLGAQRTSPVLWTAGREEVLDGGNHGRTRTRPLYGPVDPGTPPERAANENAAG